MANKYVHFINGKEVPFTEEEIAERKAEEQAELDKKPEYDLATIRKIRNQKLTETDHLALSDNVLTDEMKAFRKSMRDIPQDYSADKYDELLDRNDKGELTHTVWSKP